MRREEPGLASMTSAITSLWAGCFNSFSAEPRSICLAAPRFSHSCRDFSTFCVLRKRPVSGG
jgi:hypothetical protein